MRLKNAVHAVKITIAQKKRREDNHIQFNWSSQVSHKSTLLNQKLPKQTKKNSRTKAKMCEKSAFASEQAKRKERDRETEKEQVSK